MDYSSCAIPSTMVKCLLGTNLHSSDLTSKYPHLESTSNSAARGLTTVFTAPDLRAMPMGAIFGTISKILTQGFSGDQC
ncbi:unnamed protein product [Ceratitis capitata]|uniref:(Mediterranean fruit fly) hypothetical protein n=1 Tax=Ceratitis capitata TaxID=7213 RepID=A0A811UQN1_CERCA|nr:unnamed protein product [Ceratitis capitata]